MTTSETELLNLINRFPSEKDTIIRLGRLIDSSDFSEGQDTRVYSMDRLVTLARPVSTWSFAYILAEMSKMGFLNQIVRLYSPSGVGLQDFSRLEDVPERFHDISTDKDIDVTPDDVKVLYEVGAADD